MILLYLWWDLCTKPVLQLVSVISLFRTALCVNRVRHKWPTYSLVHSIAVFCCGDRKHSRVSHFGRNAQGKVLDSLWSVLSFVSTQLFKIGVKFVRVEGPAIDIFCSSQGGKNLLKKALVPKAASEWAEDCLAIITRWAVVGPGVLPGVQKFNFFFCPRWQPHTLKVHFVSEKRAKSTSEASCTHTWPMASGLKVFSSYEYVSQSVRFCFTNYSSS